MFDWASQFLAAVGPPYTTLIKHSLNTGDLVTTYLKDSPLFEDVQVALNSFQRTLFDDNSY